MNNYRDMPSALICREVFKPALLVRLGLVVCFLGLSGGCWNSFDAADALKKANGTNGQRLANLYMYYQSSNRGKGPKDEAALRKYVATVNPLILERMEIDPNSLDGLFVSERDGQPFEIRYGVPGHDRSPATALVFEREGVEGKRMVAFTQMVVKEVEDDSEYNRLLDGK